MATTISIFGFAVSVRTLLKALVAIATVVGSLMAANKNTTPDKPDNSEKTAYRIDGVRFSDSDPGPAVFEEIASVPLKESDAAAKTILYQGRTWYWSPQYNGYIQR
jgi:hypothetical protein